jgi:hypothetical protein
MMGSPFDQDYQGMVREKILSSCPVTVGDIKNANLLFGPDLAGVRGKTVTTKPEHVVTDYMEVPKDFPDTHGVVKMTADVMFVNGLPFLATATRDINLVTIEFAATITAKNLSKLINRVVAVYTKAGLKVITTMIDNKFGKMQDLVPTVVVNRKGTCGRNRKEDTSNEGESNRNHKYHAMQEAAEDDRDWITSFCDDVAELFSCGRRDIAKVEPKRVSEASHVRRQVALQDAFRGVLQSAWLTSADKYNAEENLRCDLSGADGKFAEYLQVLLSGHGQEVGEKELHENAHPGLCEKKE